MNLLSNYKSVFDIHSFLRISWRSDIYDADVRGVSFHLRMHHIFLYGFELETSRYIFLREAASKFVALVLIAAFLLPPSGLALAEPFDPPTISNPNLFTSESQAPRVDTVGAFTHRVPLDIPPGRNGLTPDLALVYNSQQLDDGIVGYGWSLSIPYIERVNKTGVDRLYIDNYFTSSLSGELATTSTANEYRSRFEDGGFITYTFSSNSWVAYDKKGTKYTFGATTTAQLYATTSPSNVYRWVLEEIRDGNNNYITYQYVRDSNTNQIYPYKITYTGYNTTAGIFTIDFTRATRTDPMSSYKSGFRVVTNDRITEIKASVNGSWVRKYTLSYASGQNGYRSLLSSVQETGRDDAATELTLPATTFIYSSTTPGYTSHTNKKTWSGTRAVADSDGNGLPDLNLFYLRGSDSSVLKSLDQNLYPSFTTHTGSAPDYWAQDGYGGPGGYQYLERGARYVDLTGDGKADMLRSLNVSTGSKTRDYYNNQSSVSGFSWVSTATSTSIPMFTYQSGSSNYATGLFGNVNGDGLVDYVISLPSIGSNQDSDGAYLHQATSSPMWTLATSTFTPVADMPTSGTSQVANELVDINGDGLDDWMSAGASSITFCINTGSAWTSGCSSPWNIATSTRDSHGWDRGIRFLDFNADGLPDYVRAYGVEPYGNKYTGTQDIEVGTYNYVYLNTGNGFATSSLQFPQYIVVGEQSPAGWWGGRLAYNELVDWNGDGILDSADYTSTTTRVDLLTTITYPTGGSTEVGYTFSSQTLLNPDLAFPLLLVASTTVSDNLGTRQTTLYRYEGGKMYLAGDVKDRRFAGFSTTTKEEALGFTKTYYHQGDSAATSTGEQTDSFGLLSKPFREDLLSVASSTLKRSFFHWTAADVGASATGTALNTHSLDLETSSSQSASISDASQVGLDFSGDLTAGLWVKFESINTVDSNPFIFKRVAAGSQRSYSFYANVGTQLNFDSHTDGTTVGCSVNVAWTPSTATWYHVAVTKSGTSLKFYVNGSQQGATQTCSNATIYNGTAPFEVGAWAAGSPTYHDGLLDDVRIWSRELSSTEISNLYSTPGTFSNGSSLQGWWKFNNTYSDTSGNGNTLTGNGSPVFSTDVAYVSASSSASDNYTYAETNYANPHALTGYFTGIATTTYGYDANGNVASTTGAATTTYTWDYRNRMTAARVGNATSTYVYDYTTARMRQTFASSTTDYPTKWYSITSTTSGATTTATSTAYIWHGDTLVATIEQLLINGSASGTPTTYFVHPDHLGSTNTITNSAGTVKQTLDYYPYGAERINSGNDVSNRRFIGQLKDDPTSLSYLNARYYSGDRGQFLSQDPVFLEIGRNRSANNALRTPQALNSYSYALGNPIVNKDPDGREAYGASVTLGAEGGLGLFAAGTLSFGISYVHNPNTGERWISFPVSGGVNSGIFDAYQSYPESNHLPIVLGVSGGLSVGENYSPYANTPKDLEGEESSMNLNIGPYSGSIQGAQTKSPTYSAALGTRGLPIGSMSLYPVKTVAPSISYNAIQTRVQNVTNMTAATYRSAINNIQAQINSIKSQVEKLKSQLSKPKN